MRTSVFEDIEAQAEHLRMCFMEAGYPTAEVHIAPDETYHDGKMSIFVGGPVPRAVRFQALVVAGCLVRCMACWFAKRSCLPDDYAEGCTGEGWHR